MLCTNVRQLQWNQPKGITKMEELSKYEVAQHECKKRKKNRIEAGTNFKRLLDDKKVLSSSLNLIPMCYVTMKTIIFKNHLHNWQTSPLRASFWAIWTKSSRK
ncbi:hypothetical protein Celaphus_00008426, partial [Cervus elaphus hippelaphus]